MSATSAQPPIVTEPHPSPLADEARARVLADPGFCRVFTDHMLRMDYRDGAWSEPRVQPFGDLSLSPAAMSLHYGQSVFEGLKAYRQQDGSVCTFRPGQNAQRMADSCVRLAMPTLAPDDFVRYVDALVDADRAWVPEGRGSSLYLRPVMFASEAAFGVRPAREYVFLILASPAGNYFPGEVEALNVWLSFEDVRAAEGGTGFAKCAGNYAGTLVPQMQAAEHGCSQVLYLDARERRYVEEMGGMNVIFVMGEGDRTTLVTPDLERKTLLPGVTRDSLLKLAADAGYGVEERPFTVDEWATARADGSLREMFACGTAAVVNPIGAIHSSKGKWVVGDGRPGPVAMGLRTRLLDIQHGQGEDPYGWIHRVP